MKIAIIGSRTGFTQKKIWDNLYELIFEKYKGQDKTITILTGGAQGVDTYAINWASQNIYQTEIIRPINKNIGYGIKMNYIFRNIEIITKADKVIAFWDRKSKGTKFGIDYAKARNKDIIVIKKESEM
jgi:hypothetical protein